MGVQTVGNDPDNGTFNVLGDSGGIRASLYALPTGVVQVVAIGLGGAGGVVAGGAGVGPGGRGGRGGFVAAQGADDPNNVGALDLFTAADKVAIMLRGDGSAVLGGGANGSLAIQDENGQTHLTAQQGGATQFLVTIGGNGLGGELLVYDAAGNTAIHLDGPNADIALGNADCAEEFDVEDDVVPGALVVATDGGRLALAAQPYDARVVGIVSGLGGFRPALILDRKDRRGRLPVAMLGKVTCLVDTTSGPVRCGDLLTTSPTPGHAMVVRDRSRALGAVVGKAISSAAVGERTVSALVMAR
jgi:hypothetical protein